MSKRVYISADYADGDGDGDREVVNELKDGGKIICIKLIL